MNLNSSSGIIIGLIILFVVLFNVGILVSFIRNKNNTSHSALRNLIKGGKVNFHKDKENIDELSTLLAEIKKTEKEK